MSRVFPHDFAWKMSNGRRRKMSITRRVEDYTASPTKRKDRPGSSLDHLSRKLSVLIKFSNMRAKSRGTRARIVYTYPVSDLPVDKSGRICEKQKISGSVYAMIRGPDRDPSGPIGENCRQQFTHHPSTSGLVDVCQQS